MRALITTIIVTTLGCLFAQASRAESLNARYLQGLGDSKYVSVESQIVGREFHIYTMLPQDYSADSERLYPTIYLLDGGALFPLLVSYYRYLNFGEEISDAIIVGISYGAADFAGGNMRSTDYTAPSSERNYYGGAETFQAFLEKELLPYVESTYPADPSRRIIFGQSIGGQFVLFTAQTRPSLFWGHIASNPALHRNLDFFVNQKPSSRPRSTDSRLFVASASGDDPRFRVPAQAWIELWRNTADLPWQLQAVDLSGHSHMSAPPASFRAGMRWLFSTDEDTDTR